MVACRRMKCVVLVQLVDAWESPDNSNNFGSAQLHEKRSQHTRTQHKRSNVSLTRNCTHRWPFRPITPCSRWCLWQTRRHSLPPNIRRIRLPSEPVFERYAHAVDMIQALSRSSIVRCCCCLYGLCAHDADTISHATRTMDNHAARSGATVLTMSTRG